MGSTNYYTFNFTDSRHFEVFYGNREFISAALQPNTISLHNISPNPVSTSTTISFSLPGSTNLYEVQLNILNAQGNIICNIVSEQLANGFFEYNWEPRDLSSNNIPPGLYFVSLKVANEASNKIFNQKIIVE